MKSELDEFLYIISHDLNVPLRHIREFSDLLMQKLDDGRLNEKEKLYASYIKGSVHQAENMISSLLEYSRLNTVQPNPETFDLRQMIEGIIRKMGREINARRAVINLECPQINMLADIRRMERLITELLSNALKFTDEAKPPQIEINVKQEGKKINFLIKDNGIGNIAPENRESIFSIFKKLNPNDKYPGIGSGLSMCKKITEQFGGKLWCESSDENGSQFMFTIPAAYPTGI